MVPFPAVGDELRACFSADGRYFQQMKVDLSGHAGVQNGVGRMIGLGQAAAVVVSAGLGLASGGAGAQVSVYREWRVVHHLSLKTANAWASGALVAPGRDQAWALGFTLKSGRIAGDFLERWNGRSWLRSAVPGTGLKPVTLAASSSSNVWLLSSANRAFVWDGQRWAAAPGTNGMSMSDPVVLSPSDVWTVSGGVCGTGIADHWTGAGFAAVTLPAGITAMSGSSPRNFWVLAVPETTSCQAISGAVVRAYRWTGSSFTRVSIPRIAAAHSVRPGSFAVRSARDIWLADWGKSVLWHWNGRHWTRTSLKPEGMGITPAPVVPDGHGGAWVGGCWHWQSRIWHPIDYFRDTCDETFAMARIPGTRSAWRLAAGTFAHRTQGTIEINGPLP